LPDIPTVAEFVPGYEASTWYDPRIRARIADLGNTPLALSPATYGKLLAEETEKWAKVIKFLKCSRTTKSACS
jgi:hypothetical protein